MEKKLLYSSDIYEEFGTEEDILNIYNEALRDSEENPVSEITEGCEEYMKDLSLTYYDELLDELYQIEDVELSGILGLWDGEHKIYPETFNTLSDAVENIAGNRDTYDFRLYFEEKNGQEELHIDMLHHDGTNRFILRKIKNRTDDDEYETEPITSKDVWGK